MSPCNNLLRCFTILQNRGNVEFDAEFLEFCSRECISLYCY